MCKPGTSISLGGFTDVPALSIWICNCTVSPTTTSELVSTAVIFGESPRANCAIALASKTENKTRRSVSIKRLITSRYRHDAPACVHPALPALPRPSLPAIIAQLAAGSFPPVPSLLLRPLPPFAARRSARPRLFSHPTPVLLGGRVGFGSA